MTWIGVGEYSLGACVPMALAAQANLDASIGLVLPEIQAKLAGYIAAKAAIAITPPSLSAQLDAAIGLVAQLRALIELGLPSISVDLTLIAGLIADLELSLGELMLKLNFSASFGLLLGTPGVYIATHTAAIRDVFPAGLPGGSGGDQEIHGIGIFATDVGAWTAIQAVFRTA